MMIRKATESDIDQLWEIIQPIIATGGYYVFAQDSSREKMMDYWIADDKYTYVAEVEGVVVGTFYLKANQPDLGDHICNAGFMVAGQAKGRGIGKAMGRFALEEADRLGFLGMQFNFVVSTNNHAVKLWLELGFQIVGEVPEAYRHPKLGLTSVLIMYKKLNRGK